MRDHERPAETPKTPCFAPGVPPARSRGKPRGGRDGVHRTTQRQIPRSLPRPARSPALRNVLAQARRGAVLTRGASRHRAGPLARSKRRTAHAPFVVERVPLLGTSPLADDAADLSPRLEQVHPPPLWRLPDRSAPHGRNREVVDGRDRSRDRVELSPPPLPDVQARAPWSR